MLIITYGNRCLGHPFRLILKQETAVTDNNGSKGLEGEIKTSSLYFSALVKTKASLSHPLCAFPLLDPTWSYLALSGKQKLLPRQKASCLTNQPQGRKESVLLSNVQALRLALNPVFLTYTQSSH